MQEELSELLNETLGAIKIRSLLALHNASGSAGVSVATTMKLFIFARHKAAAAEINHLVLVVQPEHGKLELASRIFQAWFLKRHPDRQFN